MPWKHLEGWGILSMQGRMGGFFFSNRTGKGCFLGRGRLLRRIPSEPSVTAHAATRLRERREGIYQRSVAFMGGRIFIFLVLE